MIPGTQRYARLLMYTFKEDVTNQVSSAMTEGLFTQLRDKAGYGGYGLIKIDGTHAIFLTVWETVSQADTALQETYPFIQEHVGDFIETTQEYNGELLFLSIMPAITN